MTLIKNSAILLAGVGAASALSIRGVNLANPLGSTGLSGSCQNAILGVAGNRDASSCLNIPGLTAVLTLQANFSAVPALNTWLQGVCRADPCSNDTINAISTNITNGCQADIDKKNIPQSTIQTIIQDIPQFYPTVRKIACLKSSNNDTLCATSSLLDIQQYVGRPISPSSAMDVIQGFVAQGSFPANLTCTECTLAAFNTFKADQPTLASDSGVQGVFSQQCGPDFLSASQPSNVVEGTGSAAPTGSVSADSLSSQSSGALGSTKGAFLGVVTSSLISVVAASFVLA